MLVLRVWCLVPRVGAVRVRAPVVFPRAWGVPSCAHLLSVCAVGVSVDVALCFSAGLCPVRLDLGRPVASHRMQRAWSCSNGDAFTSVVPELFPTSGSALSSAAVAVAAFLRARVASDHGAVPDPEARLGAASSAGASSSSSTHDADPGSDDKPMCAPSQKLASRRDPRPLRHHVHPVEELPADVVSSLSEGTFRFSAGALRVLRGVHPSGQRFLLLYSTQVLCQRFDVPVRAQPPSESSRCRGVACACACAELLVLRDACAAWEGGADKAEFVFPSQLRWGALCLPGWLRLWQPSHAAYCFVLRCVSFERMHLRDLTSTPCLGA
jgi:hypothetical protein